LILHVPGFKKGKRINSVTPLTDIYPSLCELTGLDMPSQVEGKSFVDELKHLSSDETYSYSRFNNGECVATDRYSYVRYTDRNTDQVSTVMLFDHDTDSFEINNISKSSQHKDLIKSLDGILEVKGFLDKSNAN
jgi:arylsulfatase A-like enzyme